MTAVTAASSGTGARSTSSTTIGMRTTAVAMRFSKGNELRFERAWLAAPLRWLVSHHFEPASPERNLPLCRFTYVLCRVPRRAHDYRHGSIHHSAALASGTQQSLRATAGRGNPAITSE